MRRVLCALSLPCLFFSARVATAVDPHTLLSQYGHTAWRSPDGLLNHPEAITQTRDGYIWIATLNGVFRFDGVRFTEWVPPNNQRLPSKSVHYLLGARDGSLWLGTPDGLSRFKDGRLTNYIKTNTDYGVSGILEDHNGQIWVSRYQIADGMGPICMAKESTLRCYGKKDGIAGTYGLGIAEDRNGNIWFGCQSLCRWERGTATTYFNEQLTNPAGDGVENVAANVSGEVWAAIDGKGPKLGLQHFVNGKWSSYTIPGLDGSKLQDAVVYIDKRQTLWVGSSTNGLYHVHDGFADHYSTADGLTGKNIVGFYEDVEGNMWVATERGLDSFRDYAVTTFSMTEGLSGSDLHAVLAVNGDSVWVGSRGGLDVIQTGTFASIKHRKVPGQEVLSFLKDSRNQVWMGIDRKIFVYRNGKYCEVLNSDGKALGASGTTTAFAEDSGGTIYALNSSYIGNQEEYLLAIRDQRVTQKIPLKNHRMAFLAADRHAGVWAFALNGELTHYIDGNIAESTRLDNVVNATALYVDSSNAILASTNRGLYRWRDGRTTVLDTKNGLPCSNINSVIEDDKGTYWLRTPCGILRISAGEWQRWIYSSSSVIKLKVLSQLDGAEAGQLQNQPAITETADGRVWFAGASFVQMVNTNGQPHSLPPPVHIESLIADRKHYAVSPGLELPHLKGELQIDYTALVFKLPQRAMFRYKLEGHDEDWQEAGTRRQAFYNDLPPGKYRFRMTACNGDGVWNEAGAFLDFYILPAYYQTLWFRALCAAAMLVLLWALYQLRIRQLRQRFDIVLEARVDERTRIARELHDTLLQSFQGLLLRFQAVSNLLPAHPAEAKQRVDSAIEQAAIAVTEGRDAVHELRSGGLGAVDLAESIGNFARELLGHASADGAPELELQVEGTSQALNPVIRDEVYRIAAEALRNAIRHANPKRIDVTIRYDLEGLKLRIRDDGKGIDTSILDNEHTPGHWGLRGMRERAKLIGANFEIWSKLGSGTEIELETPAANAYVRSSSARGTTLPRVSLS